MCSRPGATVYLTETRNSPDGPYDLLTRAIFIFNPLNCCSSSSLSRGAEGRGDAQDVMQRLAAATSLHSFFFFFALACVRQYGVRFESQGPLSGSPGEKTSTGGCAAHEGYFFHSERLYAGEPGSSQAVMLLSLHLKKNQSCQSRFV